MICQVSIFCTSVWDVLLVVFIYSPSKPPNKVSKVSKVSKRGGAFMRECSNGKGLRGVLRALRLCPIFYETFTPKVSKVSKKHDSMRLWGTNETLIFWGASKSQNDKRSNGKGLQQSLRLMRLWRLLKIYISI